MEHRRWSAAEDAALLAAVKDCPQNLNLAFEASAQATGRSVDACRNRWYTAIRKRKDRESIALCCFSGKSYNINRKNCKDAVPAQQSSGFRSLWERIINFFAE